MDEEDIVYKVVNQPHSYLRAMSIYAFGLSRCIYGVGLVTQAPKELARRGYKLCAFPDLGSAQSFTRHCCVTQRSARIYKARATGITHNLPPMVGHSPCSIEDLDEQLARKRLFSSWRWPVCTIMCDTITLIEEVR